MRVEITNCTDLMNWKATVGDESKMFTFRGMAYGPESDAAAAAALAWIGDRVVQ